MFMKSLRQTKPSSFHQSISYDENIKFFINQLRQSNYSILNPDRQSDTTNKNIKNLFKLRFDNLKQISLNKSSKKQKLLTFQNDYLKSLTNKDTTQRNQRKQSIKQKIKDKIKQQLASLNRNHELVSVSLRQIKPKPEIILKDEKRKVSIQGNSIPRHLKISLSQKINDNSKINYYRKHIQITSKRLMNKEFSDRLMTSTPVSPQSIFKKGRRSLSNGIKAYPTQMNRINARNMHSALSQFRNEQGVRDQIQIQPWDYTEEY